MPAAQLRRYVSVTAVNIGIVTYLASYMGLSVCGQYVSVNQGGSDNREIWFAQGCGGSRIGVVGRPKYYLSPLGLFYLPLVLLDQGLIHRDQIK